MSKNLCCPQISWGRRLVSENNREEIRPSAEIFPEIVEVAKEGSLNLFHDKSKRLYVSTYNNFKSWRAIKNSF